MSKSCHVNFLTFYSTVLHFAPYYGRLKAVKYLVEHGSDVNAVNTCGKYDHFSNKM